MRFQALSWVSLAALLAAPFTCRAEGADGQAIAPEIYAQPQRLVALPSGRRLNLFCIGDGEPTVVFEGGLGENTMTWRHVQQPVAALTRACSYDRAGYGFSDPAERASDARNTVEDLHDLLRQAGIKLPVVMVGHSIGGLYDTLYAETYPQDVAGMVLVDPSFRNQFGLFAAAMTAEQRDAVQATLDKLLADDRKCLELARNDAFSEAEQQTSDCLDNPPHAGPLLHAELNRQSASVKYITANISEWQSTGPADHWLSLNDTEMPAGGPRFGSMPLIVLTHGDVSAKAGQTAEGASRQQAVWQAGHVALAAASTRGFNILVEHSGHFIQDDQPEAVINAIRDVLAKARE